MWSWNDRNRKSFCTTLSDESSEDALIRETYEETGLRIRSEQVELIGFYSDPERDARRHSASIVYVVKIPNGSKPKAGDDAKGIELVKLSNINSLDMFSDHKTIIKDYASMVGKPDMVYESLRKDGTAFQRITCKTS